MTPEITCPELAATGPLERWGGISGGLIASIAVLGRLKPDLGAFGDVA